MRTLFFTIFMLGALLSSGGNSIAESALPKFAIGIGLELSSGSFGTGVTSTYATAPVIIDWFPTERIDLELVVPLIYQRSANMSHASLGTNMQSPGSVAAKSVGRGPGSGAGGGKGGRIFGGEYGLGDITVTSGYSLLIDSNTSPNIRPTVYVKFPTADESNGLGTGKFDFGAGLAVSKWFGNWQPFAEGRYVVQGASHNDTGAENFVTADTGVSYSWSERFVTSGFARYGSKLFDGMSAPLEVRVKMSWRFSDQMYTDVYALRGLSDGSSDYGGGASVFVEF